jgi:phospholipid transport system substrate-binding protein
MILSAKSLLDIDNGDPQARAMSVATLLDTYFDFPGITRFSSGQYWRTANAAEREEYEKALREVIISTVVRNFDQLKGLEYAHKVSTRKGNKLVLVTGEFSDATGVRPPVTVNWRVTILPDKPPLVLDIEVQNISMLVTQKQENIAIIRQNKGNFSALIEAMREKNAE